MDTLIWPAILANVIAFVLIGAGGIIQLAGSVMLLVAARRVSTGWFIGCLFLPAWPFFCFAHFSLARRPLAVSLGGLPLAGLGALIYTVLHG